MKLLCLIGFPICVMAFGDLHIILVSLLRRRCCGVRLHVKEGLIDRKEAGKVPNGRINM